MDNSEQEILESLKNFDTKNLLTKESYVEIFLQGNYYFAYIMNQKQNDQIEIYINPSTHGDVSINMLNFFGENLISKETYIRRNYVNLNFDNYEDSAKHIKLMLNKKLNELNIRLDQNKKTNQYKKNKNSNNNAGFGEEYFVEDKNGKKINIIGYKLYQFLVGDLLDAFFVIEKGLNTRNLDNDNLELLKTILLIIKYLITEVKNNLSKYKTAYFNRKLLITSKIHAILVSLEPILFNLSFTYKYNYSNIAEIEFEYVQIANYVYELVLSIEEKTLIPWPCMEIIMEFILNEGVKKRLQNYKKFDIFHKFTKILENLNEKEIKNIRKSSDMREICKTFIDEMCGPTFESLVNKSYYSYLLSCLKSQNLENKMNALNDISDIIISIKNEKTQHKIFSDFIIQNKILEMIFAEGIHDEIIKRSINLYVDFAENNLLDDKYIEEIIKRQDNKYMKK